MVINTYTYILIHKYFLIYCTHLCMFYLHCICIYVLNVWFCVLGKFSHDVKQNGSLTFVGEIQIHKSHITFILHSKNMFNDVLVIN